MKKIVTLFFSNRSQKQILLKNAFWLGQNEFFSKIILFFVTILIVRSFGPTNFGKYNLAFSYTALLMVLSDFGLNTIIIREVAKHPNLVHKYLANILSIKLIISLFLVLIAFIIRPFLNDDPFIQKLFLLCIAYSLIQNINSLLIAVFSGLEKMEYIFISKLIYYLGLLFSAILITINHSTPDKLLLAYIIMTIFSLSITATLIKINKITIKFEFDAILWKKILKEVLPFLGLAITGAIYLNGDTILIGRFFGPEKAGLYQSAYKILFAFQSINIVNNALFPRISALINQKNYSALSKLIRFVVSISLLGLIPLGLIITIFAKPIMSIIYGSAYTNASPATILLIWSGVIFYFRGLFCNLLIASNQQKHVLYALLLGTTANILFNLFIMSRYNFIYASLAVVISELIILFSAVAIYYAKIKR